MINKSPNKKAGYMPAFLMRLNFFEDTKPTAGYKTADIENR